MRALRHRAIKQLAKPQSSSTACRGLHPGGLTPAGATLSGGGMGVPAPTRGSHTQSYHMQIMTVLFLFESFYLVVLVLTL